MGVTTHFGNPLALAMTSPPLPPSLRYQQQRSSQTLQQGLDEYFAAYPGLVQARALSPAAQTFFRCHDTVHVVYGCSVSLQDEAVVKIASIFGTTEGFSALKGYALHESRDIYQQLGVAEVLRNIGPAIVSVPQTLLRCKEQAAR